VALDVEDRPQRPAVVHVAEQGQEAVGVGGARADGRVGEEVRPRCRPAAAAPAYWASVTWDNSRTPAGQRVQLDADFLLIGYATPELRRQMDANALASNARN
jgi:hypothetical protein